jgi:hypothetical protein
MIGALIDLPSSADMLANIGSSSSALFAAVLPISLSGLGILVGALLLGWIFDVFVGGMEGLSEWWAKRKQPDDYTKTPKYWGSNRPPWEE